MNSSDRLDRLETLMETLATATINNQQQISRAFESINQLVNTQLQLIEVVNNERERTNSVLERQDSIITSINAELERQGRILDYLLRRDQNGNGNNPA